MAAQQIPANPLHSSKRQQGLPEMIQPQHSPVFVSLALTARNTHISVSLTLVPSGLISFPIFPPRRSGYIENHLFPSIHPVFLLLRNSTENWAFSLQLYLPALQLGFHTVICIPVPISITWLTFSIFTESENQKTAGPLLQLTLAGNSSPPFPPPCLQESSVKFKQTHW